MDRPLSIRGSVLIGRVVSDKMRNTVVVERDTVKYYPKYSRYAKNRARIVAHNPDNKAREGDVVKIAETRKISKTKAWTVVEIVKKGESS